ncbi:hypothetical protein DIE21_03945 [Burkholderia sp. Bp9140]|nr:hypothetical protein DIE21_03945 [Burkholderia sp. Bp9140]
MLEAREQPSRLRSVVPASSSVFTLTRDARSRILIARDSREVTSMKHFPPCVHSHALAGRRDSRVPTAAHACPTRVAARDALLSGIGHGDEVRKQMRS